ncbi:alpha/beta fold hydrolase [Chromobacterium sp. IIBBL 290-4]|uniref:alpha/beta fold hydrolase n=1 Tax=Chromobacterium sp. IIBBL 290-4 TaxID=2953890 RepID=UPI0020B7339E|nr:alpha/beta fold hydrolase [Chromobacterium sp. IIBBL 290-4]UTH76458.1 alpha/beta fold hydrolase [Chromobacterium sp. IIBBL 290-4]
MSKIYLTGGTGFLGSHFIRNHLLSGVYEIECLVRGASDEECMRRIHEAVHRADDDYVTTEVFHWDQLKVIRADITQELSGVDRAFLKSRSGAAGATFFHFASSLNFEEKNRAVIYDHNINGLTNAFKVAAELKCATFFYISTAYTVGRHSGAVAETLHYGHIFNNYYEETKCAAEHLVDRLCREHGMRLVIVRPSIVIGPSQTQSTGGSKTGLYGFIREMHRLKRTLSAGGEVRIAGNPEAGVNLVPVDCLCRDIFAIFSDLPDKGGIYHVTAESNINISRLADMISSALDISGLRVDWVDDDTASAVEKLLARKTVFYNSYMQSTKMFERKLGKGCSLSLEEVENYVAQGVAAQTSKGPVVEKRHIVVTPDRVPLNVCVTGRADGEAVVFINAIGMPAEISVNLRAALQDKYRFITWESRGIPSVVDDVDHLDVSIDAHIDDFAHLLAHFGIRKAHVIGWCSGAYIAYHAIPTRLISSLTLINGAFGLSDASHHETAFMRNLRQVLPLIAGSRSDAERYHSSFFARPVSHDAEANTVSRQSSEILDATDPDLIHLTSRPFESPDSLYRYSRVITALQVGGRALHQGELGVPCHVITGACDAAVSPEESRRLAAVHADAVYSEIAGMDHFGVYNNPALMQAVAIFIEKAEAPDALDRRRRLRTSARLTPLPPVAPGLPGITIVREE